MKKEQLREWRKTTNFFCPQCDVPVSLKVGDVVIPHFAHQKNASCSASFSEGESKEHIYGKQQLYEFFLRNKIDVKLEPYFRELAQRPDLLVTTHSAIVPIEFQCSTIPVNQIEKRTAGYESVGMKPIWILHTPAKLKTLPQGVGLFHFSRFEESLFSHNIPEGNGLFTYNPQSEQYHYFSSLLHVAGRRYIGIHRTLPISRQIFPFARPKVPTDAELHHYGQVYIDARKKFLQSRILLNKKGINDLFLRQCYELRIRPVELPLWIGWPVFFNHSFREHACEWQLALVYFMRKRGIDFNKLSDGAIRNFVSRFKEPSEKHVKACVEYRDTLLAMGVKLTNNKSEIGEQELVTRLAERFLANRNEY